MKCLFSVLLDSSRFDVTFLQYYYQQLLSCYRVRMGFSIFFGCSVALFGSVYRCSQLAKMMCFYVQINTEGSLRSAISSSRDQMFLASKSTPVLGCSMEACVLHSARHHLYLCLELFLSSLSTTGKKNPCTARYYPLLVSFLRLSSQS